MPLLMLPLYPKDLCVLSRGEQGQWIKRTSVSATLGLELVEQVRVWIGLRVIVVGVCFDRDAVLAPLLLRRFCTTAPKVLLISHRDRCCSSTEAF